MNRLLVAALVLLQLLNSHDPQFAQPGAEWEPVLIGAPLEPSLFFRGHPDVRQIPVSWVFEGRSSALPGHEWYVQHVGSICKKAKPSSLTAEYYVHMHNCMNEETIDLCPQLLCEPDSEAEKLYQREVSLGLLPRLEMSDEG